MRKKACLISAVFLFHLSHGLFVCEAFSAEKMTNEQGQYTFFVPDGYISEVNTENGKMTLRDGGTLSRLVPEINVEVLTEEDALDRYGKEMDSLSRERRRRKPKMRLLKKTSVKTSHGVVGWELSYLRYADVKSTEDPPMLHCNYLLDRGDETMVRIAGSAPYDRRVKFFMACDKFVNGLSFDLAK